MAEKRKYNLEERLLDFASMVIDVVESLPETKVCTHLGGQLLRSGTSPALNYGEAQAAESKKDFVHKLQVILKELRETGICLQLLHRKQALQNYAIIGEGRELIAIFTTSVKAAKENLDSP